MPIICPTITAYDPHEYREQIEQIEAFAERIHIDLMDGIFTPNQSPSLDQIWWPENLTADIHLMYERPGAYVNQLIKMKPSLIVVHYEADLDHKKLAEQLKDHDIKAGLSIMQDTPVEEAKPILQYFDHAMVYSGHLGEHGGVADLDLLDKVRSIRQAYPNIEISWDGGINAENAPKLIKAGVDVLNVGGFIQKSTDPKKAYEAIDAIARS
jgi:ribulose-phosphate 3-epimerase